MDLPQYTHGKNGYYGQNPKFMRVVRGELVRMWPFAVGFGITNMAMLYMTMNLPRKYNFCIHVLKTARVFKKMLC